MIESEGVSLTIDSIHLIRARLSDAMPVDSGSVIDDFVGYMDDNRVTPARFQDGSRIGSVERDTILFDVTIRHKLKAISTARSSDNLCVATYSRCLNIKPVLRTIVSLLRS